MQGLEPGLIDCCVKECRLLLFDGAKVSIYINMRNTLRRFPAFSSQVFCKSSGQTMKKGEDLLALL